MAEPFESHTEASLSQASDQNFNFWGPKPSKLYMYLYMSSCIPMDLYISIFLKVESPGFEIAGLLRDLDLGLGGPVVEC